MNRQTTVKVIIYGTEFSIRTDDPEYINELAKFVDEQVQKVALSGKVTSPTKIITLAAFNIADQLFKLRNERDEISKNLAERLDAMLEMAEGAYRYTQGSDYP